MNINSGTMPASSTDADAIRDPQIRPAPDTAEAKAEGLEPAPPSRDDNRRSDKDPLDTTWLLQQTTLAPGENPDDLIRVIAEIEDAFKPKTLFERFEATDFVNAVWEERRYSHQRLALTAAVRFKALICLVTPLAEAFGIDPITAAYDYFGTSPERHTDISILLARYGITNAAINAQAADLQAAAMTLLDRRIASARSQRNIIVKEFQRRTRKAAKPKGRKSPADDDVSSGESRGLPH